LFSDLEALVKEARDFAANLAQKGGTHSRAHRGPFLSQLELEHKFNPQTRGENLYFGKYFMSGRSSLIFCFFTDISALLANYFKQFGGKSCCFTDMRP
jgi:hypothetical protein